LAGLIEHYGVTLLMGTPTFLNGIIRAAEDRQLHSLRLVVAGAEKCPAKIYETVQRRWPGLTILEGYGITECSPIVSGNTENDPRPGTIGRMLPSVEHVIRAVEGGGRAAAGQPGMLLVRGPSIFRGYLKYEGASPFEEFEGKQWYRTGDLVREDADGILTFTGRLKRFVKLGGEMISLPAIEESLLRTFAAGAEQDEGPVLAVESTPAETNPDLVLFTTKEIGRDEANQAIRQAGLSPLHNIRHIRRLEAIPVLGTGKTDYRALRALLG
jgi:long-chain-fatty-acid--[acyl-carrier-protein] ligase